jgi:hypothetical protein
MTLQTELSKLLREQGSLISNKAHPLAIEQNNKDVWTLRNKYACGSTWGNDPVFDKWWVKQVAKARNLNMIRKIFGYATAAVVAIFFIVGLERQRKQDKQADAWAEKNLNPEELQKYYDEQEARYDDARPSLENYSP